jgi:hypothetical protein
VTVQAPATWFALGYHGEPGTVVFPLVFLGTQGFSGPCASGPPRQACSDKGWYPDDWTAPKDGVLVLWLETQFPDGPALSHLPGRTTVFDGRPAKVWSGGSTAACVAGTASEIDAYVARDDPNDSGDRLDMSACFGSDAPAQDRAEVQAMLATLKITG